VFDRDGIITAFELLWLAPSVAKGVLEPGKIVHEKRKGEIAQLGEVPFGNSCIDLAFERHADTV
jgi:glycogen debranching enzyme